MRKIQDRLAEDALMIETIIGSLEQYANNSGVLGAQVIMRLVIEDLYNLAEELGEKMKDF